jgi:chromosome partitioning protein
MKPTSVREDLEQWLPLVGWLAQRKPLHIEPGTPAITSALTSAPKVATVTLGSLAPPPAPAAPKPSVFTPPAAGAPQLNPRAVMNAVVTPSSALTSKASGGANKIERAESLLPSLLRRVFG